MSQIHTVRKIWGRMIAGIAIVASFAATVALPAQSEQPARPATTTTASGTETMLRMRVRSIDDAPVADAEISVKSDKLERVVRSDAEGIANFGILHPGTIEIRVRRIGFKQTQLLARVEAGNNELTVNIDGAIVSLADVRIVGNRTVMGRHEDFDMRLKRGDASSSITAEQIAKRNPIRLSQMLRSVPGVRISEGMGQTVAISTRGKNPGKFLLIDCVMRVMVDGVIQPANSDLDVVVPDAAYGIEVFNGPAAIPLKLQGVRNDLWCGLIAIWTKGG